MSGKLARRTPKEAAVARANALQHVLADLAEEDAAICAAANKARRLRSVEEGEMLLNLTDQQLMEKGWSREDLQVATDARHCSKEAPQYMSFANRRAEVRWRNGTGEKPSVAVQINLPAAARRTDEERDNAPVIDVTALGEKP